MVGGGGYTGTISLNSEVVQIEFRSGDSVIRLSPVRIHMDWWCHILALIHISKYCIAASCSSWLTEED